MIVSTWRDLWSLYASKKSTLSFTFFLRYCKNIATLLFLYEIGGEISITILVFVLDCFHEKLMTKFFKKSKKNYLRAILGHFCPNLCKNELFLEKRALSVFKYSHFPPSCKKSEKTNDTFMWKLPNWQTDGQTTVIL